MTANTNYQCDLCKKEINKAEQVVMTTLSETKELEFSDDLLSRAKELGVVKNVAKTFATPESLERALIILKTPSEKLKTDGKKYDCGFTVEEGYDAGLIRSLDAIGQASRDIESQGDKTFHLHRTCEDEFLGRPR